ncbi:MAG TPA: hypothetical protein VF693_05205 [Allosphingosinicella sp.]|jgi:hypothetical protein
MRRAVPILLALTSAAVAQPNPGSYPTIETAPPAGFGTAPPDPDRRPSGEASWYAQAHGVSEAEAQRRMRLQHEVSEEIGRIGPRLEAEQRDNYADIWIEHSPEWRVVVGFVRDPEATLRRYTSSPLFVARQVRHSLAELRAGQEEAFAQLRRLGVPAEGGTYVSDNEVRISAAVDSAAVAALLASGRLRVRPFVRVTGADALDPAEPVAEAARRFVRILPQARHRTGSETAELNIGTIVLRDGCFRLDGPGEDDPFAFFGAETGVRLDEAGALILYQRGAGGYGGDPARVGERMVLGGGAGREIDDAEVTAAVRAACGPGRVVTVGNPRSYAAFRRRYSAWRVDAIAQRQRTSRDEAWRRLTACWAREDEYAERVRLGAVGANPAPPQPCEDPPPPPPPPRR